MLRIFYENGSAIGVRLINEAGTLVEAYLTKSEALSIARELNRAADARELNRAAERQDANHSNPEQLANPEQLEHISETEL